MTLLFSIVIAIACLTGILAVAVYGLSKSSRRFIRRKGFEVILAFEQFGGCTFSGTRALSRRSCQPAPALEKLEPRLVLSTSTVTQSFYWANGVIQLLPDYQI